MGLIKKIWNGELPLVKVYWIYGVLGGVIIQLIIEFSYYLISFRYIGIFTNTLISLLVCYQLLISVGIWRSANAYQKNKVWAVLAKVVAVAGLIAAINLLVNTLNTTAAGLGESELKEAVALLNKTLPTQIDSDTRVDRVDAENNAFNLHYTLVNYTNSNELANLVVTRLTGGLIKNACDDVQLKGLLNKNIPINYIYSDKLGAKVTTIVVDKTKCKN